MNTIGVVVLNWERGEDTLDCLQSLEKLCIDNLKVHVVVVDNASTDDSPNTIRKELKKLTTERKNWKGELIRNRKNLGFAGGNNVGVNYLLSTRCDYILLLNNDTVVDKNLLVDLLRVAEANPEGGVFSPKIYFAKGYEFHKERYGESELGKVIWSAGGKMDWENVFGVNLGVDEVDSDKFNGVKEIDFATGACLFVRRETFSEIGVFDEKYFMYFEDADFCCRARKGGWKSFYVPPAHLWHKVSQSSGIGSGLNDYFIARNRLLFGMRWAPLRARVALYKESLRLLAIGREWQKKGVRDFYFGKLGKGSWGTP